MQLRISRAQIDAIKAKVDIAALVAERGITLKRVGRTLFALCPFHAERTPSFTVSRERGLFHCFGCGVGGDAIGFLVRHDRLSFPDALRSLAARAGVALEDDDLPPRPGEDLCGRTEPWQ